MDWDDLLDHYGAIVEGKLMKYFKEGINKAKVYHPFIGEIYSDIEEFILRKGRRMASCTTLLTYKGYSEKVDEKILRVCVGIELYRHSILVHDDLIDKDKLRRGGKTLHRLFTENYDTRFGEGVAVFAGDLIYALAQQSLLNSGFQKERLVKPFLLLSEGYHKVNESQILDLLFEHKEPDIDEWYIMASRRAASLFKTTILVGAILGDAPERDLQVLEKAATHIGYSFDIQDDIIDTFASLEQYGRIPGGDIALGKKPLHVIYTLKLAKIDQQNKLKNLMGKEQLSPEDHEWLRMVMKESGALEAAKEKMKKHAEEATALIIQTDLNDETKDFFSSLLTYITGSLDWYR